MQSDWATENLLVIRTLMERSAIYRRALAPIMLVTGTFGLVAAAAGVFARIQSPRGFVCYWVAVAVAPLVTGLFLVRRQALRASEPFWSPPTKRVAHAVLPPLVAALAVSAAGLLLAGPDHPAEVSEALTMRFLPLVWVGLYGCACHGAGFFMRRGLRLFGWILILGGCAWFFLGAAGLPRALMGHGSMGLFFGILHLAYGVYLLFTEPRANAT